jgi:hypothetical protein
MIVVLNARITTIIAGVRRREKVRSVLQRKNTKFEAKYYKNLKQKIIPGIQNKDCNQEGQYPVQGIFQWRDLIVLTLSLYLV